MATDKPNAVNLSEKQLVSDCLSQDETDATDHPTEDTTFSNAPWKFKLVALFTALFFTCKKSQVILTHRLLTTSHSRCSFFNQCIERDEIAD